MGRLTTHVLDATTGTPASNVAIRLLRDGILVAQTRTNADGRCDAPLLEGDTLCAGIYDLILGIGDHFSLPHPRFLDEVVLRFTVGDTNQNYHVPLIATPFSTMSYRGS